MKEIYYAQTFSYQPTGKKGRQQLTADNPIECKTAEEAKGKAERLAEFRVGAIAVSQEYDEGSEEFGGFTILARYGNVPIEEE